MTISLLTSTSIRSTRERPYAVLRQRRELRYSRDQQALSDVLMHCRTESSTHDLQVQALQQIHQQLQMKLSEDERRLSELEQCQRDSDGDGTWVSEALAGEKAHVEARLKAVCSDEKAIKAQLANLKTSRSYPPLPTDDVDYRQEKASRSNANLSLFLQKSPTKLPLVLYPPLHPYFPQRSSSHRIRNSAPELQLTQKHTFHSRTKSSIEDARCHHGGAQRASSSRTTATKISDYNGSSDHVVLAVDEFANSFSSRVIIPSQAHKGRNEPLRHLRLSSKDPTIDQIFASRPVPGKAEFGSVTIIPQQRPRRRSEFTSSLHGVELPSYVQNLMEEFEGTSKPSVPLEFSDYRWPVRDVLPASSREKETSPLSTSPLTTSPISPERSSPSLSPSLSPTKLVTPRFSIKHRTIFTLHLPRRPDPASASRSTLVASPTTSVSECTIEVSTPARMLPKALSKIKGLPSTRMYDLSQLDKAPDDLPMTPTVSGADSLLPLTPRKSRLVAPLSALRDVKSRLVQFRRR